jgi:hypothetical protein
MVRIDEVFAGNLPKTQYLCSFLRIGNAKCKYKIGTEVVIVPRVEKYGIEIGTLGVVVGNGWLPDEVIPAFMTGPASPLTNDAYLVEVKGQPHPLLMFNTEITTPR